MACAHAVAACGSSTARGRTLGLFLLLLLLLPLLSLRIGWHRNRLIAKALAMEWISSAAVLQSTD